MNPRVVETTARSAITYLDFYLALKNNEVVDHPWGLMAMHFSEEREGEVTILSIEGRLDATSTPAAEQRVHALIEGGAAHLLLDLEKVDYMSSAGMRLLLSASKRLKSQGGKLVLAGLQDAVREVLQMAGFDQILEISATRSEALKAF